MFLCNFFTHLWIYIFSFWIKEINLLLLSIWIELIMTINNITGYEKQIVFYFFYAHASLYMRISILMQNIFPWILYYFFENNMFHLLSYFVSVHYSCKWTMMYRVTKGNYSAKNNTGSVFVILIVMNNWLLISDRFKWIVNNILSIGKWFSWQVNQLQ